MENSFGQETGSWFESCMSHQKPLSKRPVQDPADQRRVEQQSEVKGEHKSRRMEQQSEVKTDHKSRSTEQQSEVKGDHKSRSSGLGRTRAVDRDIRRRRLIRREKYGSSFAGVRFDR